MDTPPPNADNPRAGAFLSRMACLLVVLAFAAPGFAAITAPRPSGLTLEQLDTFRIQGVPDDQWPMLLETLGREEQRSAVRTLIKEQQPFPAAKLVEMLAYPTLSVRLGALDLLEDAASETFGFDPWLEDPRSGGNVEALERWKSWAAKAPVASTAAAGNLTDETFRAIALEIMSDNRERVERGMLRLEGFGLGAIAHLEAFLKTQTLLEAAPRAALKAAEYRVVLLQALPKQAAALARDLAQGGLEAQSTALSSLSKAGPGALPVIADFLASSDPLVRETAVDAACEAGKQHAVPLLVERLSQEKAESVLHALLRGLGQHARDTAHVTAMAAFLEHPSENVVISATEALGSSQAGDVSTALAARLADPRWRVRAAALEAIGKRNLKPLQDKVVERIGDSDQFVRVTAIETLQKLADENGGELMLDYFNRQDDLKATILRGMLAGNRPPPVKVWEALEKAPPEIILQCLDTLEDRDDYNGKRVPYAARFVAHPNRDVSASALRILAGHGRHTALLLEALRAEDAVKRDAVLDQLKLQPGFLASTGSSNSAAIGTPQAGSNPVLDKLYELLGKAPQSSPPSAGLAKGQTGMIPEAQASPAEMRAVLERLFNEGSPRQRFRAATVLASQGDSHATQALLDTFDTLSSLDRRTLAGALGALGGWAQGPALQLATRLLRDPADDVREQAIEVWLETKQPERLAFLLAELVRPGSLLQPDDLYGWELDRLAQDTRTHKAILDWSRAVLDYASSAEAHKVFAIVLLNRSGQGSAVPLEPLLDAPTPWLRRAAYRALGLPTAAKRLDALLRDDAALVRATLPFLAAPHNNGWRHHFDDAHSVRDYEDYDRNRSFSDRQFGAWAQTGPTKTSASPEIIAALEKLTRDSSDLVRFEAQFALLRLGRPIDPPALAALLAAQPEDNYAHSRLGNFLESNYARLGKAYGILLPLATEISESNQPKMLKHFGLDEEKAFTSFSALAQLAPSAAHASDTAVAPPETVPEPAAAASFRVIYFYKPGCRDCERARDMLNQHAAEFPLMLLEERNIQEPREAVLNEALSARFRLRDTLHQVTPAVFTQAGALVREEVTFPRLADLLRKTQTLTPDAEWLRVGIPELSGARQTITQRYESMSFGVVAAAGLLDGINPCAFATIIFLLSYLQIARRSPGEILAVGAAFISAVFLAYFAVGLGLSEVLARIAALRVAGTLLNYTLAGFALVIAVLSFRDAQLAARGELGAMTLQLPSILKEQIRSAIRTGTRASRFVLAAFAAGIVISLLELACTGQVYLPTILYMLRAGRASAVGHLVVYNVAFVVPLIVVFLLAWGGLRSEALIRFQRDRTALVKVLTGLLFLLLTVFLLFGHTLVPRIFAGP